MNFPDVSIPMGDFKGEKFADNHYLAFIKEDTAPSRFITLGASETTKALHIPFPHRINKICIRQTDASNVGDNSALALEIRRDAGTMPQVPAMKDRLYYNDALGDANSMITLGEPFEYEATTWILGFTGTATKRVHLLVYIQRIGGFR